MQNEFTISTILPAPPEKVFRAWLSSEGHAAMTGSPARIEPRVGGAFTAWDGYTRFRTIYQLFCSWAANGKAYRVSSKQYAIQW